MYYFVHFFKNNHGRGKKDVLQCFQQVANALLISMVRKKTKTLNFD